MVTTVTIIYYGIYKTMFFYKGNIVVYFTFHYGNV